MTCLCFSALSRSWGISWDGRSTACFVTAMLTVIGFSVHDTVVIFDRVRENLRHKARGEAFEPLVNRSINQTLARSVNTSLTVIMTLLALVIFGGQTTRLLNVALLIGIISGTYSSIFNAASILVGLGELAGEAPPSRPSAFRNRKRWEWDGGGIAEWQRCSPPSVPLRGRRRRRAEPSSVRREHCDDRAWGSSEEKEAGPSVLERSLPRRSRRGERAIRDYDALARGR